ncbi:MAG: hypothetical protein ACRDSL_15300 [Pseudonocardiaceae bacterium]
MRLALDAIEIGQPGGIVLPVSALRDQVAQIHRERRACRFAEVATDLPALIRNLHTTLGTGADHGELLELAVYLHVHVTSLWLGHAVRLPTFGAGSSSWPDAWPRSAMRSAPWPWPGSPWLAGC